MLQIGLLIIQALLFVSCTYENKYSADVQRRLQNGEKLDVVVSFTSGVSDAISASKATKPRDPNDDTRLDRGYRNSVIIDGLKKNADISQESATKILMSQPVVNNDKGFEYYRKYWLSNTLFLKQANSDIIKSIAKDPKVAQIQIAPLLKIESPAKKSKTVDGSGTRLSDNLMDIGCQYCRDRNFRLGKCYVRVAVIDSGVRHTHHHLDTSQADEYGWHDGVNGTSEPYDAVGHGTFVLGLLVGSVRRRYKTEGEEIGVNHRAVWMACLACISTLCEFEHIMNCLTWVACPSSPDGSKQDCSDAPDVLLMALMSERNAYTFDSEFYTLGELEILPVIATEDTGPNCDATLPLVRSANAIRVGCSTLHNFPEYGQIKPDLVAPCEVHSLSHMDDKAFTFMLNDPTVASAFVAGTVSLFMGRKRHYTLQQIRDILTKSANLEGFGHSYEKSKCKGIPDDQVIPVLFGSGALYVYDAMLMQSELDIPLKEKDRNGYVIANSCKYD